jgi:hypothetical protein
MEEVPVKYRKRKEMTPERLALLEKAREKAQLVIQEREKLKNAPVPEPEPEPVPEPEPEPVPVSDEPVPEPVPVPNEPVPVPAPSISRDEIANLIAEKLREAQPPAKKYHYVNGMYVKIK